MTLKIGIGHGTATEAANIPPDTPTITAGTPTHSGCVLYGSAFHDDDPGDTHLNSYWQVSTTPDFANIVAWSGYTTEYLTTWTATGLDPETLYYAEVFYGDSSGGYSGWSPYTTFTTAEAPTTGYENIAVQVTRIAAGTGTGLCSTGIPLPSGTLFAGEESQVKVTIGGVEQSIYVESLLGTHSDNSLRSILVQFNIDCDYNEFLTGTVEVGDGVSRNTTDISKTTVVRTPTIVCLPTSADYLLRTDIVPPTISVADVPSTPTYLQTYETNFVYWGDRHWDGTAGSTPPTDDFGYNYYDRALIWLIWWVRTGTYKWWYRFLKQAVPYIDWLEAVGWGAAPHNALLESIARHYWLVGDSDSRYGVTECARIENYFYHNSYIDAPNGEGRIQARLLEGYVLCIMLDDTSQTWETWALDVVDRTLATQSANGAYDQFSIQNYEEKPFMSSMVYYDFWLYYTYVDADSRLLPSLQDWLDFMIANMWVAGDLAFKYQESSTSGSPDLNGMIMFPFSWYYETMGGSTYLTYANDLIQGLNNGAWLYGFKQFNQCFRQSSPYMLWRSG